MFELTESAEQPARSGLHWIANILAAVGAGLVFVEYRFAGLLLMIAGYALLLLNNHLTKKERETPGGLNLSDIR